MRQLPSFLIAPVALALAIQSGCATITTGTEGEMTVTCAQDVEGARCTLVDSKDHRYQILETPGTVSVVKGDGPMTITCEKEGYWPATVVVEESFQGATLGNIILGGGIGIIVDAASGAAQCYPEEVVVWLEPKEWPSAEARQEWLEAKRAYEAKLQSDNETSFADEEDL